MEVRNPKDGSLLGKLEETKASSLAEMIKAARKAQLSWRRVGFDKRKEYIEKFSCALEEESESLARNQANETGKPIKQARGEIAATKKRIDFFLEKTGSFLQTEKVYKDDSLTEEISYEPVGLIANISAWNYPYFVGSNVFIPALLTGNGVLYKPSEWASLVGQDIFNLFQKVGLPKNLFNLILGDGAIGSRLIEEDIDGVFFTGSYRTGKKIAEKAAPRMLKIGLELGGKDPAYVTDCADPQKAAIALADGAFYNAGQSCCAVERIYVHEKVYDAFLESFLAEVKGFKMGDPLKEDTYLGPLTRASSAAFLEAQVADALAKGAQVKAGGQAAFNGRYFSPTVLVKVNHAMKVMREESFGPIIGIQKVGDDKEAAGLMADTPYGLTAAVYGKEEKRARDILEHLETGSVYFNMCDRISPRLPWSGRRHSGIGSTLGEEGIRAFLKPKAWHLTPSLH